MPNTPIGTQSAFISFIQDTVQVKLSITSTRKENIGNLSAIAIDGKMPDSLLRRNNLIIRVIGDTAKQYNYQEIYASYTDSLGNTFSNDLADSSNKVQITKIEKKVNGVVEGVFTIRVSNFTKTKTLLLNNGKISSVFIE